MIDRRIEAIEFEDLYRMEETGEVVFVASIFGIKRLLVHRHHVYIGDEIAAPRRPEELRAMAIRAVMLFIPKWLVGYCGDHTDSATEFFTQRAIDALTEAERHAILADDGAAS